MARNDLQEDIRILGEVMDHAVGIHVENRFVRNTKALAVDYRKLRAAVMTLTGWSDEDCDQELAIRRDC